MLECSELVRIGHNCVIDPHAVIHGPTTIGDNVQIKPFCHFEDCTIGEGARILGEHSRGVFLRQLTRAGQQIPISLGTRIDGGDVLRLTAQMRG